MNKTKRRISGWEMIYANEATDNGLISKYYKLLMQLNIRKNFQSVENLNRYYLKEKTFRLI